VTRHMPEQKLREGFDHDRVPGQLVCGRCGLFTEVTRTWAGLRCFPCYVDTRVARARAKRRSK
jgi:hypothetical protein